MINLHHIEPDGSLILTSDNWQEEYFHRVLDRLAHLLRETPDNTPLHDAVRSHLGGEAITVLLPVAAMGEVMTIRSRIVQHQPATRLTNSGIIIYYGIPFHFVAPISLDL